MRYICRLGGGDGRGHSDGVGALRDEAGSIDVASEEDAMVSGACLGAAFARRRPCGRWMQNKFGDVSRMTATSRDKDEPRCDAEFHLQIECDGQRWAGGRARRRSQVLLR